jgi:CHASE3 domain sensor protein
VILVFALAAIGVPIALAGQLGIIRTFNAVNLDVARIRQGQFAADAVLQLQTDEETGIRGYAQTRDPAFLEPYHLGRMRMAEELRTLGSHVDGDSAAGAVAALRATNAAWLHEVAEPVLRGTPYTRALARRGKALIDRFRAQLVPIQSEFDERYTQTLNRRNMLVRVTTGIGVAAVSVIAIGLVIIAVFYSRLRDELGRDRAIVEALQNIASTRLVVPAQLDAGVAYRSATRGARVGGDVYDLFRLDDERTLLVVGDVSGKGLTAAIDTTFVRYSVRALAGEALGPSAIVTRFDALYRGAALAPEAFVSLFVAIHDSRTGTLDYANAGHEAAWIRRGAALQRLDPTGPICGIGGFPFGQARASLAIDDLLVLATDGLTEARTPRGGFVTTATVEDWLTQLPAPSAQLFVDGLLAELQRFTRHHTIDDVAILVVRPNGD